MRLLFAGTPDTAVPTLQALVDSDHEVVAVLTRPDARAGRGRSLAPSPVKEVALAHRIPVLTPTSTRDEQLRDDLLALDLAAAAIVAYGGLIPASLLRVPTHGWINLHFSVLPAWRGAAPVQRAIMAGDTVTGASTFVLEEGLDTGPVLGTMTEAIRPEDTAGMLLDRLAHAGAGLMVATLDGLAAGALQATVQPLEGVSHAPKLTVAQAQVPWQRPGYAVDRHIRGCTPAPGAWTHFRGQRLGIGPVRLLGTDESSLPPGLLLADKRSVIVGTGSGPVALDVVTPQGKRAMAAADWARGVRIDVGERFEE